MPKTPSFLAKTCKNGLINYKSCSTNKKIVHMFVSAHGRVNDPMAKLQFLRVGWGGVGMMTFFELEHMLDATQLCLSCHCTHAGCYATVFALSLHICWMLRNCVCLVIAHMLDATQLCLSCRCTHAGCYATVFALSLHICWMLRNCVCLVIAHMLDATQLCLSCQCTHAGCYATVFVLSLHACWMLRNCFCLVIAHMLDATPLCLSCHCTGQIGPQSKQCQKMVTNDVFFSADGSNTHEFQAKRLCEGTNPWKKWDEMNI